MAAPMNGAWKLDTSDNFDGYMKALGKIRSRLVARPVRLYR